MSTEGADSDSSDGEQHECPECGKTLASYQGVKIHYGVKHEGSIGGVEVECSICGETKRVRNGDADNERHFCSTECEKTWRREMPPEQHPRWNGGKLDAICDNCDKQIKVWPSHSENDDHHFCDEECKREWMGEYLSGPDGPTWTKRVTVACAWCGETVKRRPEQVERSERSFCDNSCNAAWLGERYSGENSPRWKGGLLKYGSGWGEQKRERVKERDSYECQMCGIDQETSEKETGRELDVHHIVPARQIEDPEVRNGMENLISLCCSCHGRAESMAPLLPAGVKPKQVE